MRGEWASAAVGLGGFFPPLLMGTVMDATGSYAIGCMLLSEFALLCLVVNILVLQGRARPLLSEVEPHSRVGDASTQGCAR